MEGDNSVARRFMAFTTAAAAVGFMYTNSVECRAHAVPVSGQLGTNCLKLELDIVPVQCSTNSIRWFGCTSYTIS